MRNIAQMKHFARFLNFKQTKTLADLFHCSGEQQYNVNIKQIKFQLDESSKRGGEDRDSVRNVKSS